MEIAPQNPTVIKQFPDRYGESKTNLDKFREDNQEKELKKCLKFRSMVDRMWMF